MHVVCCKGMLFEVNSISYWLTCGLLLCGPATTACLVTGDTGLVAECMKPALADLRHGCWCVWPENVVFCAFVCRSIDKMVNMVSSVCCKFHMRYEMSL